MKKTKVPYKDVLRKSKCKPLDLKTKKKSEQLSISWDFEQNPANKKEWNAVILYVPQLKEHEHFHVELTRNGAKNLCAWLKQYLKETAIQDKKKKT